MRLTDWRGNEYGVGDTILYATSQSSSLTMHQGTVIDIVEGKGNWDNKLVTKVKVQPTRTAGSYGSSDTSWGEKPFKPVTLSVLNRITFLEKG